MAHSFDQTTAAEVEVASEPAATGAGGDGEDMDDEVLNNVPVITDQDSGMADNAWDEEQQLQKSLQQPQQQGEQQPKPQQERVLTKFLGVRERERIIVVGNFIVLFFFSFAFLFIQHSFTQLSKRQSQSATRTSQRESKALRTQRL